MLACGQRNRRLRRDANLNAIDGDLGPRPHAHDQNTVACRAGLSSGLNADFLFERGGLVVDWHIGASVGDDNSQDSLSDTRVDHGDSGIDDNRDAAVDSGGHQDRRRARVDDGSGIDGSGTGIDGSGTGIDGSGTCVKHDDGDDIVDQHRCQGIWQRADRDCDHPQHSEGSDDSRQDGNSLSPSPAGPPHGDA